MNKCFRLLGCFGLASAYGVLRGTPYPSLNEIQMYLEAKGGTDAVVTKAFKDVYEESEKSDFKNTSLIGAANGSLTLPKGLALTYYKPAVYRDWQWKFDTIYGFFSCTVQGVSVFDGETLRKAVEKSEEGRLKRMLTRCDTKKIAELTKVCRVLLSEAFAKRLLTEPLLKAFYDNKDAAYSCFDVDFSPDVCEENVFRFDVMYSQTVKDEKRSEKGAFRFAVRFRFGYDLEKRDFGGKPSDDVEMPNRPQLECLDVNGKEVCSNPLNFDERAMERVWKHPYREREMCKGEEQISEKEKEAVAGEEEREISEKSKEGLGLKEEEEEEDLKVHTREDKEKEALRQCDPNKRPRSFDSDDERSEKNFKKKKE